MRVDKPLHPASVHADAFEVTLFDGEKGWQQLQIRRANLSAGGFAISLYLAGDGQFAAGTWIRVVARGRGPTPLLGADMVPLAGGLDGEPASRHRGNDYERMLEVSSESAT